MESQAVFFRCPNGHYVTWMGTLASVLYKIGTTLSFTLNVFFGDFSRIAPWDSSRLNHHLFFFYLFQAFDANLRLEAGVGTHL